MSTILLDDNCFESPELIRAARYGSGCCWMWVAAICYGSRHGRTRLVPVQWFKKEFPRKWKRFARGLVHVGLFTETPDGFEIVENRHWKFQAPREWSKVAYEEVYERDGFLCRYCGSSEDLSIDHLFPRCRGGTDHAANLVVACRSCNSRKGGRTPEQAGMALRLTSYETDTGITHGDMSSSESSARSHEDGGLA